MFSTELKIAFNKQERIRMNIFILNRTQRNMTITC